MNYAQYGLFFIFVFALLIAGVAIYRWINREDREYLNRAIFLGESLLLGSIWVIGWMVFLSLVHLYRAPYLWTVVACNYLFLLNRETRQSLRALLKGIQLSPAVCVFAALLAVFMFRNAYFLVDVDSHSTYLYAQKLWLEQGTSIFGSPALDMRIFTPHMNAVPYALGIGVFGQDTLFPQLIVAFWTVVLLLLVFGYLSFRFNHFYGLAGVMLVLWDPHMFYSGANQCCIINSLIAAFAFAAIYNFWESRSGEKRFRWFLAVIFLSQLIANKYQFVHIAGFIFIFALVVQKELRSKIMGVLHQQRRMIGLLAAAGFALLWYIKNWLATGLPTFPILAGNFGIFNWSPEMQTAFYKFYAAGLPLSKILKYLNYLFIWPGVKALKMVIVAICVLPFAAAVSLRREKASDRLAEWAYWLAMSMFFVVGMCMVAFPDPRNYRYGIAVFSVAAVLMIDYLLRYVLNLKKEFLIGGIILLMTTPGFRIMLVEGGSQKYPSWADNLAVLSNKLHFADVLSRHYPDHLIVAEALAKHQEKFSRAAWDAGEGGVTSLSAFLLPSRPQVGFGHTSVVQWDSGTDEQLAARDIREAGIEWIMRMKDSRLVFLSPEEYAREYVSRDWHPKEIFYNYGFPQELSEINYDGTCQENCR